MDDDMVICVFISNIIAIAFSTIVWGLMTYLASLGVENFAFLIIGIIGSISSFALSLFISYLNVKG